MPRFMKHRQCDRPAFGARAEDPDNRGSTSEHNGIKGAAVPIATRCPVIALGNGAVPSRARNLVGSPALKTNVCLSGNLGGDPVHDGFAEAFQLFHAAIQPVHARGAIPLAVQDQARHCNSNANYVKNLRRHSSFLVASANLEPCEAVVKERLRQHFGKGNPSVYVRGRKE